MKLEGVMTALVTPYAKDGTVSEEMLRQLVEAHIKAGVHGLYLCGGGGEGILLSTEERKKVAEVVVSQVRRRIPVIVHVGATSTDCAAHLACHAKQVEADVVASVPPFYYRVSLDGIIMHYRKIAESSRLPLMLYNIPSAVGYVITPGNMKALIKIPEVTGMKFASEDLFSMRQILELDHGRLSVLSGCDEVFLAALAMGAHGSIGLTHNFMPKVYVDIYLHYRNGDIGKARELQYFASRVVSVLIRYPVIPASKAIVGFQGLDCGPCRGPLERLTEQQTQGLHDDLAKMGFFEKALGF
jgi:N-acetylneuraminate lyase